MKPQQIRRFPFSFVWFHAIIVISFTICLITGLPLKLEWWELSRALGGHDTTKWIHRIAGAVLIADASLYCISALLCEIRSGFKGGLWPRLHNVKEFFKDIVYLISGTGQRPKFNKYSCYNIMEFWAAGIGIMLMSISGLVLWFPRPLTNLIIETCHAIHSWEAVLALVAIYLWHVYHVHSIHGKPRLNRVWLTGMIHVDELKHEYPAEYDSLVKKGEIVP